MAIGSVLKGCHSHSAVTGEGQPECLQVDENNGLSLVMKRRGCCPACHAAQWVERHPVDWEVPV